MPIANKRDIILGTKTTHRSAITSDDSAYPAHIATAINCTGYKYALVECVISGTSFNITPGFTYEGTTWYKGETRTISQNERLLLETYGTGYLYILVDGEVGTSTITVYVTLMDF